MAALDAKTVNAKSVETVKLNCIQKISSTNNKRLWQLNKAYREAEHDLQLMESIGAISKKEVEETMDTVTKKSSVDEEGGFTRKLKSILLSDK